MRARHITVLTASTGVVGTFADPTLTFGNYFGTLLYPDPYDVLLSVRFNTFTPLLPPGAPQNVLNVAQGIDNAISGGVVPPTDFQNLFNFTPQQLQNALTQLEGQPAADTSIGAYQLMTEFMTSCSIRPRAAASPGRRRRARLRRANQPSLPTEVAEAYDAVLNKNSPATTPTFNQRWSAWASAFGGYNTIDGNATLGSANVTASTFGVASGMSYHVTPSTYFGFALGGGGINWGLAQGLGDGRSDTFMAGVYGTTHWGAAYLSGALGFGNHWFTTNRTAVGDQLTAKFEGQSYTAKLEAGYRFGLPVNGAIMGVTPYAAVQTQYFRTPSYSETDLTGGGFGLNYASMKATDTRSELGTRFDDLVMFNDVPVVLRGRLAWAHDWIDNPALGAVFQTLPGSNFTVNGATPPADSVLAGAGAELFFNSDWSLTTKFDGQFAGGYQSYAGTGTLRYRW